MGGDVSDQGPLEDSRDDGEVFARWYRIHHARLLSQCNRFLRDRAAAEDVAHETLLRAWLGRERMREEDLGAWLSVVARNLCVSHVRKQRRMVPSETLPDVPDVESDPAVALERTETRRTVRRALSEVGERHRKLLFLREVHGAEYEELGAELGLSPEGARSIAFRARRVLRARLAAAGEGFAGIALGFKARVFNAARRLRNPASIIEPMAAPAFQAGLGLVLAAGIAMPGMLSHVVGSHEASMSRNHTSATALNPNVGPPALVGAWSSAAYGAGSTSGSRGAGNGIKRPTFDPYTGNTAVPVPPPTKKGKGHTIHFGTVGSGQSHTDDLQRFAGSVLCTASPHACDLLGG